MQENNMSVFGTVIRNEEIADFMRLLNLARNLQAGADGGGDHAGRPDQ